jgi:hypothetical protein
MMNILQRAERAENNDELNNTGNYWERKILKTTVGIRGGGEGGGQEDKHMHRKEYTVMNGGRKKGGWRWAEHAHSRAPRG